MSAQNPTNADMVVRPSMDKEVNIELIRALEKQIEEGKGNTIELKRARNSLLSISTRIPPEILGYIFAWVVSRSHPGTSFASLEKGSHNFTLVCHRWFKVATNTPELWTFWGNTLKDWNKRCHRKAGVAPVDLVFDGDESHDTEDLLSSSLRDALRDLSDKNRLRQIHLRSDDANLFASIFSSLAPGGEHVTERCTESIILMTTKDLPEISNFFARSRLPNLRHLEIQGVLKTPFFNHLTSQTTHLIALDLRFPLSSPSPTTSKLISVLSNPNLQELGLVCSGLPVDTDGSGIRAPLRHLRKITLMGGFHRTFKLLQRLELPAGLDHVGFRMTDATLNDVLETFEPYVRNHFRRDVGFKGRLEAIIPLRDCVGVFVKHPCGPGHSLTASFSTTIFNPPPRSVMGKLATDIAALIPHEHVVSLETEHPAELQEELFIKMPNIETLVLYNATLPDGFLQPNPDGPHANKKLLPSLQFLRLVNVITGDAGWEPLIVYVAHQTSGGQTISLEVTNSQMTPEAEEEIRNLVGSFVYDPFPGP